MKKLRKIIVVFLLIALLPGTVCLANNHIAASLERRLLDVPLPQGTQLIESRAIAGKMMGNGNGMQWFGVLLIRSDLDAAALREWYGDQVSLDAHKEEVYVSRQETPGIFGYGAPRFRKDSDYDGCYRVVLFRSVAAGAESSFWEAILNMDLRGH